MAGGTWPGNLLIVDWEEFESAESINDVYLKRFKAAEVQSVKIGDKLGFPLAEGALWQPSGPCPHPARKTRERASNDKSAPQGTPADSQADKDDLVHVESQGQDGASEKVSEDPLENDLWAIINDVVILHHQRPGQCLYVPEDGSCLCL